MQRVILVRHGEGFHNATRNWKLPDPHLTDRGRSQARALCGNDLLTAADLVVVSPLLRAVQTALEIYGSKPTSATFLLTALHSEVVGNRCDRGRPKHEVAADCPEIAEWQGFEELPEHWMHTRTDRKTWREQRLPAFRAWLCARLDRCVVVVGHQEFFKGLCGKALENCEVFELPMELLLEPMALLNRALPASIDEELHETGSEVPCTSADEKVHVIGS